LIFRGLNFSCNTDIGQIGHLWMGTNYSIPIPIAIPTPICRVLCVGVGIAIGIDFSC
jgi:hypothetical protein